MSFPLRTPDDLLQESNCSEMNGGISMTLPSISEEDDEEGSEEEEEEEEEEKEVDG